MNKNILPLLILTLICFGCDRTWKSYIVNKNDFPVTIQIPCDSSQIVWQNCGIEFRKHPNMDPFKHGICFKRISVRGNSDIYIAGVLDNSETACNEATFKASICTVRENEFKELYKMSIDTISSDSFNVNIVLPPNIRLKISRCFNCKQLSAFNKIVIYWENKHSFQNRISIEGEDAFESMATKISDGYLIEIGNRVK